jgi:ABC-type glycerol-3-phosphate transport system substrate-binding protein
LAACGAPGSGTAEGGKPATGAVAASGNIRWMAWGNAFSDGIENKVVDAFNQRQGKIKVEFVNTGSGDAFEKVTTAIAGGDPPETALVDGYNVRALVKRGGAMDVTQRMSKDGVKNQDAAWEWMKFLGGYDAMLIYGVEGRFVPALKKAAQAPEFLKNPKGPKNVASFTDSRVKTLPLMPEYNDFNRDIWAPNLKKIWDGVAPAKEVAPEIARQTTEFIKNREKY